MQGEHLSDAWQFYRRSAAPTCLIHPTCRVQCELITLPWLRYRLVWQILGPSLRATVILHVSERRNYLEFPVERIPVWWRLSTEGLSRNYDPPWDDDGVTCQACRTSENRRTEERGYFNISYQVVETGDRWWFAIALCLLQKSLLWDDNPRRRLIVLQMQYRPHLPDSSHMQSATWTSHSIPLALRSGLANLGSIAPSWRGGESDFESRTL